MKEVLVINLKRNGDIFTTGHIIRSILKKDPNTRISLLVLKEFERAAEALKGISQIYSIDRKKILTFAKNRIFSDGFALDQLNSDLNKVMLKSWDTIFNYSNDRVSTHITTLLKGRTTKHIGIRFNDYCNVEHSNEWSIIFNDVLPEVSTISIIF